ncbi:MAG: alpha/beta hydrolase [Rhodospirillaceae bacterium]|nr:alpha/beta hydrolase [Rhodospirillaceae bacterium]MBT3926576.1 alpha/beta hydrolase [Rhodospirillaceae bacterium]
MAVTIAHKSITISGGVTLRYQEAGAGKPLVMLPGWSQSAAEFKYQIAKFVEHRRVIALDQRGHGESDKPAGGYRIARLAADLREVLIALDLSDVDLLGHSMGCSVSWSYLDLFGPERLSRLILVDEAAVVTGNPSWPESEREALDCLFADPVALAAQYQNVLGATDAEAVADLLAGMFTPGVAREDLVWIGGENLKMPRQHAADLVYHHVLIDWRDLIPTIRLPTLVVGGDVSIFSARSQHWLAEQIPGAECVIFGADEGGSHFMFYENPEKFNAVVEGFLG